MILRNLFVYEKAIGQMFSFAIFVEKTQFHALKIATAVASVLIAMLNYISIAIYRVKKVILSIYAKIVL